MPDSKFDSQTLKKWFSAEQRDLPWRIERTPYAVWISEMMLQQTQVAVVIPYFQRWMIRFPTVHELAKASIDEVIKIWEGLGYYSRARYLHAGARQIVENHNGVIPDNPDELKKIKGLGPYTTGAIRSFAFHHHTPAVDGNVIRVLSRYFMLQDDISKPATLKKIWNLAAEILPEKDSWIINEALIELGATVCSKKPKCSICPLKKSCKAYAHGMTEQLPYKSAKISIENLYRGVPIISHEGKFLIRRGQKGEIMSDLHEFPYFDIPESGISENAFKKKASDWLGCKLVWKRSLPEVSQSFTRFRVKLTPMEFICESRKPPDIESNYQWLTMQEISNLAFSSGHRRILKALS